MPKHNLELLQAAAPELQPMLTVLMYNTAHTATSVRLASVCRHICPFHVRLEGSVQHDDSAGLVTDGFIAGATMTHHCSLG